MKSTHLLCRISVLAILFCVPIRASALSPDEIVLVVNRAEPIGKELATFYAAQRNVPQERILELDNVPKTDEMTTRAYEESVVPQVRAFMKSGHLDGKIKCLVTFYGVPLRIGDRVDTQDEVQELMQMRQTLIRLPEKIGPAVGAVEAMAVKLDSTFTPVGNGNDLEELRRRFSIATQSISSQIQSLPNHTQQAQLQAEYYKAAIPLLGKVGEINKFRLELISKGTTRSADMAPVQAMADDYKKTVEEAARLEQLRYDAQARQQLGELAKRELGLLVYVKVLKDQVDYLNPDESAAAFDNELAMVQWLAYPRRRWIPNPLNYEVKSPLPAPTFMVMRLDAPDPDIVKSIITTSIKIERQGLTGKVVIDSLGVRSGEATTENPKYATYDQYLRNLGELLRSNTKLEVTLDEKPDVLPVDSATDVALYCGWHSPRNYIAACKFKPGAVGYHMGSWELVSLRGPNETGWVHGMLVDGVAAALGPVAEPYIESFPRPDEFFPLLLTGKLTLAEAYWKTEPFASWMQSFIGDPLYTPYKTNPQLNAIDLPYRLRSALPKDASGK